jgi:hypothetical protein
MLSRKRLRYRLHKKTGTFSVLKFVNVYLLYNFKCLICLSNIWKQFDFTHYKDARAKGSLLPLGRGVKEEPLVHERSE